MNTTTRAKPTPLTQLFLNAIKPGSKQTDYRDGAMRGLALRVSPGGAMTWTLIKRVAGEGVQRIMLGPYIAKAADEAPINGTDFRLGQRALSLKQAREAAAHTLTLISEGRSPAKEKAKRQHLRTIDAEKGSLAELLHAYAAARAAGTAKRAAAGARQIEAWGRLIKMLEKQDPDILAKKAKDIKPQDVVELLHPMFHRGVVRPKAGRGSKGRKAAPGGGAQGGADKLQALLRAAFTYGLFSENSVERRSEKTFGLEFNPVASVPREAASTPGTRALSNAELRQFWTTIHKAPKVGKVMAGLLKFGIASGGQRLLQLAREPWASYDTARGIVSLVDPKGRGSVKRLILLPMTQRMRDLLKLLTQVNVPGRAPVDVTPAYAWPWATRAAGHIDINSPASAVAYWLQSEYAFVDGVKIEPFTPRDLRRTCTQIMQTADIPDGQADRLQSHGIAGVTSVHYRNNPEKYLPEKKRTIEAFDAALAKIID